MPLWRAFVRSLAVWVLSSTLACAPVAEPDRAQPRQFDGDGFTATLRRDVRSSTQTPEYGVTLYDFHIGSLPLLFMYVGDQAGYPHFGWAAKREQQQTLRSGLWAHCRYAELEAGQARECLIVLSKESPQQLMVFYDKLPAKWAKVADAIIDSIAPRAQGSADVGSL